MTEYISKINMLMSKPEIAAQLAEECAELGHAALKLRRTMMTGNPTPVSYVTALDMLKEELADLSLVLNALDHKLEVIPGEEELKRRKEAKAVRWIQRLEGESGG